jgi:hypothetical protein
MRVALGALAIGLAAALQGRHGVVRTGNGWTAHVVHADTVLDSAARATVVNHLARDLDSLYVIPERGASLARLIRRQLASGAYANLRHPRALADALSKDLSTASHDTHLSVRYFPPASADGGGSDGNLDETWINHGFPEVRILEGNVGYIDIRSFTLGPEAERASNAAMSLLADCDALIIDIRNNGGGNTPAMARVAGYLFADRVHLTDLHWRDEHDTVRVWTPAPTSTSIRLDRQPAFILIGQRTFSAAEDFAYSLQALHRATTVGETTSGGAHSGKGLVDLGFDIKAFIPSGESLNPITRTNWEGTGVRPDIPASDATALRVAYGRALTELLRGAKSGARRDRLERALKANGD